MKLWPILGFACMVTISMQNESKLKTVTCYTCPANDPFCRHPRQTKCRPGEICYVIHLKSIGVTMGCSKTVTWNDYESEYCHRYIDQFAPFVATCIDCSLWDLCNGNTAIVTKLFYPLVVVGVLINVHLSA